MTNGEKLLNNKNYIFEYNYSEGNYQYINKYNSAYKICFHKFEDGWKIGKFSGGGMVWLDSELIFAMTTRLSEIIAKSD
jgi:hypothetical protein